MQKKINWADKQWKKLLIEQRKNMWLPDTIEKLAKWLDLKEKKQIADIGCGLGYLGFTFWDFFAKDRNYTGVDVSEKLLQEASEISKNWAIDGKAFFKNSNAYKLDLEDNTFDLVMCQTLLMHLDKPEKAISEMKRILKPGGIILCIEPDNLSHATQSSFYSFYDETIEERVLKYKTFYYGFKGRKKLGFGDNTIGNQLPMLLYKSGFKDINIRKNDRVDFKIPPYDNNFIEQTNKLAENSHSKEEKKNSKLWQKILRRDVLAGGGSKYLLKKYFKMTNNRRDKNLKSIAKIVKSEEYFYCGASFLYVAKGIKQ